MKDFLLNGEFTHHTIKTYDVLSPIDGSVLATLPSAGKEDVDAAVAAAKAAFDTWRFVEPEERQRLFFKWAELIEERAEAWGEIGVHRRALVPAVRLKQVNVRGLEPR